MLGLSMVAYLRDDDTTAIFSISVDIYVCVTRELDVEMYLRCLVQTSNNFQLYTYVNCTTVHKTMGLSQDLETVNWVPNIGGCKISLASYLLRETTIHLEYKNEHAFTS